LFTCLLRRKKGIHFKTAVYSNDALIQFRAKWTSSLTLKMLVTFLQASNDIHKPYKRGVPSTRTVSHAHHTANVGGSKTHANRSTECRTSRKYSHMHRPRAAASVSKLRAKAKRIWDSGGRKFPVGSRAKPRQRVWGTYSSPPAAVDFCLNTLKMVTSGDIIQLHCTGYS
jgi:hypothetical protein